MDKSWSEVNSPRRRDDITAVEMAVNAVTGDSDVMEMPMKGFDPDPTALDLDDADKSEVCPNPPHSQPAEDGCVICGLRQPASEND